MVSGDSIIDRNASNTPLSKDNGQYANNSSFSHNKNIYVKDSFDKDFLTVFFHLSLSCSLLYSFSSTVTERANKTSIFLDWFPLNNITTELIKNASKWMQY